MDSIQKRIDAFVRLGDLLSQRSDSIDQVLLEAKSVNPWFTENSIRIAINGIVGNFLHRQKLEEWINAYPSKGLIGYNVATVLAGNIPLVGFHDILAILLSGNNAMIKPSSKDIVLIQFIVNLLYKIDPSFENNLTIVNQLSNYDAVIATGSNNSGQYFKKYFSSVPHIIRGNRNSIAILSGNESKEELRELGKDIFTYYGLGCRNVSKIYIPDGYNINELLEVLHEFNEVIHHHKYKNNFDYNVALYLLNKQEFLNNGCIILKKDSNISSRIACCNFDYYSNLKDLDNEIQENSNLIQCIVASKDDYEFETVKMGMSQSPGLFDYADGVDTMEFLTNL